MSKITCFPEAENRQTDRITINVQASLNVFLPESIFGKRKKKKKGKKSPKPSPIGKVRLHNTVTAPRVWRAKAQGHTACWNILCETCTCAVREVRLYGDTRGVTVSSHGAQRRQVTRASATLSHLVQPIQFRGIEGAKAPVATVDLVTVTNPVTGFHRANVVSRFIKLLFSYVSKM